MHSGALPRGAVPRPVTTIPQAKRPIPPTMFRFQALKKTRDAENIDVSPKTLPITRPQTFLNSNHLKNPVRPPIPQNNYQPRPRPLAHHETICNPLPPPLPPSQYQSTIQYEDQGNWQPSVSTTYSEYQLDDNQIHSTQDYNDSYVSSSYEISSPVPTQSTIPTSSPTPSSSSINTPNDFNTNSQNVPVFTNSYTVPDNVPSSSTDVAGTLGSTGNVEEIEKPNTIQLPPGCKLFQYTWIIEGIPRTLLIPMPIHATEADVKAMLPQTLDLDPDTFNTNKPQEELPTLAYPAGLVPDFEEPEIEDDDDYVPEEPILVNPKQYLRIMKRRETRQRLEDSGKLPATRQKYLHESRHRHALNRKRGHDGRFDHTLLLEPGIRDEEEDEEEDEEDEDDDDDDGEEVDTTRRIHRRNPLPIQPRKMTHQISATQYLSSYHQPSSSTYNSRNIQHNDHHLSNGIQNSTLSSTSNGIPYDMDDEQHTYPNGTLNSYSTFDNHHYSPQDGVDGMEYQGTMNVGVDLTGSNGQSFTTL